MHLSSFLGEILVKRGLLTESELKEALKEQKESREFLGKILLKKGLINEKQLLEALSERFNLALFNINDENINWELADRFPKSLILDHRCFPVKIEEDTVIIAIDNPLDAWIVSEAQNYVEGYKIKRVLVSEKDMEAVLDKYRQKAKERMKRLFSQWQQNEDT